jgi:hypothetical protein
MIHDATKGNPSTINFVMFVAVFAMLSLIYLIAATVNEGFAISPFFMLAADALNTLFFLVGGIALAASLNVHSCSNSVCLHGNKIKQARSGLMRTQDYLKANGITNGAANMKKRCHEAQAVTAFLWFGFATFLGSLAFSALAARGGGVRTGGIRRGGPAMSQA